MLGYSESYLLAMGALLDINANSSLLSINGAKLQANTSGQGNAGNINITATSQISFDGSDNGIASYSSAIGRNAIGNAGNVKITTGSLSLTNGSFITIDSEAEGNAGNLEIFADSILLQRGSTNLRWKVQEGSKAILLYKCKIS